MNHRRHKAMRFVKLSWITKEPRRALVFYLINTPLPKSRFLACISSRITTVIQVVRYYQINDNWFNEPFAVSLYRLLILRHAWLNLWDKHMTTGRINQVTTIGYKKNFSLKEKNYFPRSIFISSLVSQRFESEYLSIHSIFVAHKWSILFKDKSPEKYYAHGSKVLAEKEELSPNFIKQSPQRV